MSPDYQLKKLAYPFPKTSLDEPNEEKTDAASDVFNSSTLINYKLPSNCFVDARSAKIMYWNQSAQKWDDENITDTDYDAGNSLQKI